MLYEQTVADRGSRFRVRAMLVGLLALACLGATAARPSSAGADIPFPYEFMPSIEGVSYQGQSTCVFAGTHWPGVMGFRNLLNFWFGSHYAEDWRECSRPGQSEHKESRALDYYVHARSDPGTTLRILAWLLETDEHGNRYARARRLGVMYIVSNGRMFRLYDPGQGWTQQGGCPASNPGGWNETHCHVNHIHFSFTWPGARKETSWWTTTQWARTSNSCRASGVRVDWLFFPSGFGPLVQIKRLQAPGYPVYDTQAEIRNSPWRVETGGKTYRANQPVSSLASPRPRAKVPAFVPGGWCYVNLT